jgi:hypothetical protein
MHPFWPSHVEKRVCVRLSTGGHPWPELELHGRPWVARKRGEGKGERGEERGAWLGRHGEREGCSRLLSVVREKETGRRKKKERRKEKEGKEK